MTTFSQHLGLAFQIVDDVLDETSTPDQMGKQTNKDAARGKNTYPSLLGIDGAQREAHNQLRLALTALRDFDSSADALRALATFVVMREN